MLLSDSIIKTAKQANLIEFMLTYHPDRVMDYYGIRDIKHDSLVLYPDSFCRYSTGEVQDSIYYLEHYQGYRWRDAVLRLKRFSESHPEKSPAARRFYGKRKESYFYKPIQTDHIGLIRKYLYHERGIGFSTIDNLIEQKKIYAATAPGYGVDYVCFSNFQNGFYSLRNISSVGMPKLLFTKESGGFWWFTMNSPRLPDDPFERLACPRPVYAEDIPIFVFESPIDAISFYEFYEEPGIYAAMGGLKDTALSNILSSFPYYGEDCKLHFDRQVILAVDRDGAGDRFSQKHDNYERIKPTRKDWNEDLTSSS
jgi:hypothetical protein